MVVGWKHFGRTIQKYRRMMCCLRPSHLFCLSSGIRDDISLSLLAIRSR